MQRRRALHGLGASLCWGVPRAQAQANAGLRRVAVLQVPSAAATDERSEAFRRGMHEHGWVEGRNLEIVFASAEGDLSRLDAIAAELLARRPEVIVNSSGASTRALQRATRSIPIVMVNTANPVANGFVASLARPGGNITGQTNQQEDTLGKAIEALHEVAPAARRVAIVVNEVNPSAVALWTAARSACAAMQLVPLRVAANTPAQLPAAVSQIVSQRAQAVLFIADPMFTSERREIQRLMHATRLPAAYGLRDHVLVGGLLSFGVNLTASWHRAATFVDKILRCAKPADMAVEQLTKFELVINLKTARALGLTIPQSLLLRADEVIG